MIFELIIAFDKTDTNCSNFMWEGPIAFQFFEPNIDKIVKISPKYILFFN